MASSPYGLRGFEEFYTDDNQDIRSRMKEIYNDTATITQSRWVQQSIDERFYAGDQSLWNEIYSQIPAHSRKQFNFNKIKRIVNMISGYQRKNRKTLDVIPVENSDQQTADQFSKVLRWANGQQNVMNTVSEAFLGSLITGMNLLSVWMDYRTDPFSGDLKVDNMSYNGYLIDPYFKKTDLSDCNYIWTRKFLAKKQIASLMPDRKEDIMKMSSDLTKDAYFNFLPQNYMLSHKDLLSYDEFWYLDYRDATIIVDPVNEESIEWNGPEENLKLFLMRYPQLKKQKIQKQTCKLAISVNNRVMYDGINPYKIDKYPFVPIMAYYHPELPYYEWRIQGVVRSLRDAQFLLNRRQQILLDVLESQVNSGLKVMEDSLVDDKDAFKSGQGQALFIKKDAPLGMGSIEKIAPANVSPIFVEVINQMNQSMMEISGVNEELLGSAEDDKAGILSMLRQGAGLTTLQILFDHLDESLKVLGTLELDMIQSNFSAAKVKRIIEEEPTREFFNKTFQKYDCVVVEGLDTPTQRMEALKQALYLREIGIPISGEFLLEMSNLQNKTKLIEQIAKQEQQQAQMQEMQVQLQMQEIQARTELASARAGADRGLENERATRSYANMSLARERELEGQKDLEQATLDKIKSIKELQGIDLEQIQKALEIIQLMKGGESQESKAITPNLVSNSSDGA
jgi:aromatic ring-cleaving dioxygenase